LTEVRKDMSNGGNISAASVIGKLIAERPRKLDRAGRVVIVAVSSITGASKRWLKPRVKPASILLARKKIGVTKAKPQVRKPQQAESLTTACVEDDLRSTVSTQVVKGGRILASCAHPSGDW